MRWLATVVALFAAFGFSAAVAQAGAKPKLTVAKVSVTPGKVAAGGKIALKATVRNRGAKRVKAKLNVKIDPSVPVFASPRIGKVRSRGSKKVKLKLSVPGSTPPASWNLQVCVKPGKSCRSSGPVSVFDDSSWTKIEEAKLSGRLSTGKALLYELYALSGNKRLPKQYRGPGDIPAGTVFANLAAAYPSLSAAEQAKLVPYMIQPRYRQSAWAPSKHRRLAPRASTVRPRLATGATVSADPVCDELDTLSGFWTGTKTTHAWFWARADRPAARRRARALASEFEKTIWPKLTKAFKTVDDSNSDLCDPLGDSRIDIYLSPPGNSVLKDDAGVTPGLILGKGCGPHTSFIILREDASRSILAHEFMHAIQWRYPVCDRVSAWVEGTAAWAEDYVYHGDQHEHVYPMALLLPYNSLLSDAAQAGYHAWPFWFSLYRKEGIAGLQRVFNSLAGGADFPAALEAGSSDGLREAWKRFAIERWNQGPVGAPGFSVAASFRDRSWDSFKLLPLKADEVEVTIGSAAERTFDLPSSLFANQAPLTTWFNPVKITDSKVRQVEFQNGDFGRPGAVVQAMIRLASGEWRLEDWSERSTVNFCRDKPAENVVELVIATSNASATGGPLGAAGHELTGRNICDPPKTYSGPVSGTAKYDASTLGPGSNVTASWNGRINLTRIPLAGGSSYPFYFQVDPSNGGSLNYSVNGTLGDCHLQGTETFSLSELGQYPVSVLTINGGDPVTYSIRIPIGQGPVWQATRSGCSEPSLNGPFYWAPGAGAPNLAYSALPRTVDDNGNLKGSSTDGFGFLPQTMTWDLAPGN